MDTDGPVPTPSPRPNPADRHRPSQNLAARAPRPGLRGVKTLECEQLKSTGNIVKHTAKELEIAPREEVGQRSHVDTWGGSRAFESCEVRYGDILWGMPTPIRHGYETRKRA
eukprot:scaffold6130_cov112-Isochrysis_galbana.AAC.8